MVSVYMGLFCSFHFGKELKVESRRPFRAYIHVAEKHKVASDWLGFLSRILDHGHLLCIKDWYGMESSIGI